MDSSDPISLEPDQEPTAAPAAACDIDATIVSSRSGSVESRRSDPAVIAARTMGDPMLGREIGGVAVSAFVGEGGMGRVYSGTLGDPPRTVAVKLLSRGFNNPEAVGRFQREAAILDRLHHPGIAEIISHGVWDDGSGGIPYMVMELVEDAKTLADFAAEKRLDARGRLELFHRACEAIAFAHEMAILHRDLKPANLLVDRFGRVKVIDFGVARAANGDLGIAGVRTETGQLIGTLQYMSPEQIAGDPRAIDLRTDVYALGVILYEMLLDAYPYDVRGLPIHEAARVVSEALVERPKKLDPTIDDELDRIVMRCLDRDRTRRYDSAGAVAAALENYLAGPSPSACGASRSATGASNSDNRDPHIQSSHASQKRQAGQSAQMDQTDQLNQEVNLDAALNAVDQSSRTLANARADSRTRTRKHIAARGAGGGSSRGGWTLVIALAVLGVGAGLVAMGVVNLRDVRKLIPGGSGGSGSPAGASAGSVFAGNLTNTESLTVLSAPSGATVTIDGESQGRTPLSLKITWTGSSQRKMVEVSSPGFDSTTGIVMPDPAGRRAEPLRLVFNLAPGGASRESRESRDSRSETIERLLPLRIEGGAVEVSIDGGAPQRLERGLRELLLKLPPASTSAGTSAGASAVSTRAKFTAPGQRIDAFGRSGVGELEVEIRSSDITDQAQSIRLTTP